MPRCGGTGRLSPAGAAVAAAAAPQSGGPSPPDSQQSAGRPAPAASGAPG